mmetsp:Transcript_53876/g.143574  ORF Transcript_53876/g.143574 Transcript_53876/m.143574 type:complete len:322 (-) Transcript_53876:19-984(-)
MPLRRFRAKISRMLVRVLHLSVEVMVALRKQALDELLLVDAPAAVAVEELVQLVHALRCQAQSHALNHPVKLLRVQHPVPVLVENAEELPDVLSRIACLPHAVAGPLHEKNAVSVLPHVVERITYDAKRDGCVEHRAENQHADHDPALIGLWINVAVAQGRHRDDGHPHAVVVRVEVVSPLHDEEDPGEAQQHEAVYEDQHGQGFQGHAECLEQEVQLEEAPQHLGQPQKRDRRDEKAVHARHIRLWRTNALLRTSWLKANPDAEQEGDSRCYVDVIVEAEEKHQSVRADHKAEHDLQGEYHVDAGLHPNTSHALQGLLLQ